LIYANGEGVVLFLKERVKLPKVRARNIPMKFRSFIKNTFSSASS
jgi:hypothetical protein